MHNLGRITLLDGRGGSKAEEEGDSGEKHRVGCVELADVML